VIGIVAAGYGDGYSRFLPSGTPLLVNGRRVPLAGSVSMDMAAVDLGPQAEDKIGDSVLLWGDGLPVEEIARAAGTIPYQLVTGVMHREPALAGGNP
jgi:alanine racemase